MMNKKAKDGHSIVSNIFFILKLMFKISPGLVIGEIVVELLTTLPNKLISVIGIKYIIDEIGQPDGVKHVFIALALMVAVIILENVVNALFFELFAHRAREKLYLGIHSKLYEKAISLDLQAMTIHRFTAISSLQSRHPRTISVLFSIMSEAMLLKLFHSFQSVQ